MDPPPEKDLTAALRQAVTDDDAARVRDLLAAGAEVNAVDEYGDTVLVWASDCDGDVLKALVEGGANVNHKGVMGVLMNMNALSLESLETLINAGADVDATYVDRWDSRGFTTPLHTAVRTADGDDDDDEHFVRVLLKAGAATETRDYAGSTPLHWAGHYGSAKSMRLLLEGGAQIDAIERKRWSTALLLVQPCDCQWLV